MISISPLLNAKTLSLTGIHSIAETRKQLIYDVQKILADEIPMLLLYGKIDNTVYRPAKYDRWTVRYDHAKLDHPKLSYIER